MTSILAVKNNYYKNGIWWFTKMLNRVVGEERYQKVRIERRVLSNQFYYLRQQWLYTVFIETPEMACLLGMYPKINTTHGFGSKTSYQMYRDFQENTINSDGSFGMWVALVGALYICHEIYNYALPWYWNGTTVCKNGEEQRVRMRDAIASTIIEETYGLQWPEWGFTPHMFHRVRTALMDGYGHPDDVRAMHISGLNRKHRYVQHYTKKIGEGQKYMSVV